MSDLLPVKCRACGEVNFVQIERDFVQIGLPASLYDEVIRLISRRTKAKPTQTSRTTITPEERQQARGMRSTGMAYRDIATAMGWTLATTWRQVNAEEVNQP